LSLCGGESKDNNNNEVQVNDINVYVNNILAKALQSGSVFQQKIIPEKKYFFAFKGGVNINLANCLR